MDRTEPVFTPNMGPPSNSTVSREIYALMGEDNIFAMLADFYDRLGDSPAAHLFPTDRDARLQASKKSGAFFTFLLGGPPLYQQRYGPPRMRMRHIPFIIDEPARQAWLACFRDTLDTATEKYNFPEQHLDGFWEFLVSFSAWMVNAGPTEPDRGINSDTNDDREDDNTNDNGGGIRLPIAPPPNAD